MTNSFFGGIVIFMMFAQRFVAGLTRPFSSAQGREKRNRVQRVDVVAEQVRKVLQETDQKLILMVRG